DRVVWRHSSGGVLVLPVSGSEVVTLSGTGEDVWELLSEPHTVQALGQRLAERYAAPQATVLAELGSVLDELSGRGVLVRTDRP
ncbi:MAG: PqqD family protein, partial [Jiangellaceae bacterium]